MIKNSITSRLCSVNNRLLLVKHVSHTRAERKTLSWHSFFRPQHKQHTTHTQHQIDLSRKSTKWGKLLHKRTALCARTLPSFVCTERERESNIGLQRDSLFLRAQSQLLNARDLELRAWLQHISRRRRRLFAAEAFCLLCCYTVFVKCSSLPWARLSFISGSSSSWE